MNRLHALAMIAAMTGLALACSSSSSSSQTFVPLDGQAYCGRITGDCSNTNTTTSDDCLTSLAAVIVPPSCNSAIASTSCADLQNPGSAFGKECYPPRGCQPIDGAFICSAGGVATECFAVDGGGVAGLSIDCNTSCKTKGRTFDSKCADQCGSCNNTCFGSPGDDNCCCQ
jgi:hypothetical protein